PLAAAALLLAACGRDDDSVMSPDPVPPVEQTTPDDMTTPEPLPPTDDTMTPPPTDDTMTPPPTDVPLPPDPTTPPQVDTATDPVGTDVPTVSTAPPEGSPPLSLQDQLIARLPPGRRVFLWFFTQVLGRAFLTDRPPRRDLTGPAR